MQTYLGQELKGDCFTLTFFRATTLRPTLAIPAFSWDKPIRLPANYELDFFEGSSNPFGERRPKFVNGKLCISIPHPDSDEENDGRWWVPAEDLAPYWRASNTWMTDLAKSYGYNNMAEVIMAGLLPEEDR